MQQVQPFLLQATASVEMEESEAAEVLAEGRRILRAQVSLAELAELAELEALAETESFASLTGLLTKTQGGRIPNVRAGKALCYCIEVNRLHRECHPLGWELRMDSSRGL